MKGADKSAKKQSYEGLSLLSPPLGISYEEDLCQEEIMPIISIHTHSNAINAGDLLRLLILAKPADRPVEWSLAKEAL